MIPKDLPSLTKNLFLGTAAIVLTWLIVGTAFYAHRVGWTWETAYYYTIEAGLAIGFSNYAEPSEDSIHAFTVFIILLGSSVSGSIALSIVYLTEFDQALLEIQESEREEISLQQIIYSRDASLAASYIWHQAKYWCGWYSNPSRTIICIAWVLWILLGTLWWVHTIPGKQTYITGIFFAVSTCSTAGLLAPPCHDKATTNTHYCQISVAQSLFVGSYALVGVPLHSVTWGVFGAFFLEHTIQHRMTKKLFKPITKSQYQFYKSIMNGSEENGLSRSEYALLELWRLGKVSKSDISVLLDKFDIVDTAKSGTLCLRDLVSAKLMEDDESLRPSSYHLEIEANNSRAEQKQSCPANI